MVKFNLCMVFLVCNIVSITNTTRITKDNSYKNILYEEICSDRQPGMVNISEVDFHGSTIIDNLPGNQNYIYDRILFLENSYKWNNTKSKYYTSVNGVSYSAYVATYNFRENYYGSTGVIAQNKGGIASGSYSSEVSFGKGLEVTSKEGFKIKEIVEIGFSQSASYDESHSVGVSVSFDITNTDSSSNQYKSLKADFDVNKYLFAIYIPNIYYPGFFESFWTKPSFKGYNLYYYYYYNIIDVTMKLK